ncbi:MAG: SDR family oxidoreductase [Alphaproteobacteria bacterium]|nr:SDR family oxidoreductase [Alphaproteobacteria bacterium]
MRAKGKVVFITGGSTGLGLATARAFHREGARVAILGRRPEVLEAAAGEIGAGVLAVPGDATSVEQIEAAVARIVESFGGIDVVVHSAGGNFERTNIEDTTLDGFRFTYEANTTSAFIVVQQSLKAMKAGGSIVLIGSVAGMMGSANRMSYATAKAAMIGMTRQLALTLGPKGIRVNLVAPGMIRTPLTARLLDGMSNAEMDKMVATYPLGRLGDPDDVAYACLYLGSDEAKWVTGITIPVAGGRVTH